MNASLALSIDPELAFAPVGLPGAAGGGLGGAVAPLERLLEAAATAAAAAAAATIDEDERLLEDDCGLNVGLATTAAVLEAIFECLAARDEIVLGAVGVVSDTGV